MIILQPLGYLTREQVYNLDINKWCICQDWFNGVSNVLYCFVCVNTLQGFNTRIEAQAILNKYGIRGTRENAESLRVGVFTIGDARMFFRGRPCTFCSII